MRQWLATLGLERYGDVFEANDVDLAVLPHLTEVDFDRLGVTTGHRRLLQISLAAKDSTGAVPPERRQLSVMFCDLIGSTEISAKLDPEDFRDVLLEYQRVCATAAARFEGHLAKYLGDGALIYFGYPKAHDDDARRSILAGLEIVAAVRRLNGTRVGETVSLAVRVGINTGLVVAGEVGSGATRETFGVVGEAPNLAARLQAMAEPNTVVISSAVHRLAGRHFECRSLGVHLLKGIPEPVEVFLVEAAREWVPEEGAGLLVGRQPELEMLLSAWSSVREGEGRAVLIAGEPGIGKSCLISHFRRKLDSPAVRWVGVQCSPYFQNSAFYPIASEIRRVHAIGREESSAELMVRLQRDSPWMGRDAPLLAELLSGGFVDGIESIEPDPQMRKARTLDALRAWLTAAPEPTVVVVEDLHWADASTLELLGQLFEKLCATPALVIGSYRSDFSLPWSRPPYVAEILLSRLSDVDARTLACALAGEFGLPATMCEDLTARADGVPLFLEELVAAMRDTGLNADGASPGRERWQIPVPETLRDLLTARLDSLGSAKSAAQLAAVIGRECSHELLESLWTGSQPALGLALARLADAGVFIPSGHAAETRYSFKHALLRDAAYESILKSTRKNLHHRIAETLVARHPTISSRHPEFVGYHYEQAGRRDAAAAFHEKAGDVAFAQSANAEAVAHYSRALDCLPLALASVSARERSRELDLLLKLGPALQSAISPTCSRVAKTYDRALELALQCGRDARLFVAQWGRWQFLSMSGREREAAVCATQLVTLARTLDEEDLELEALHAEWTTNQLLGDARAVVEDTGRAARIYDRKRHHRLTFSFGGHDPGICALGQSSIALWLAGRPAEALIMVERALALCGEIEHAYSKGVAFYFASMTYQCCGNLALFMNAAESVLNVSTYNNQLQIEGEIFLGRAKFEMGEETAGLDLMSQAVARIEADGSLGYAFFYFSLLADAQIAAGRLGSANALLKRALGYVEDSGQTFFLPEIHRLAGEAALADRRETSARESFAAAAHIAAHQHATSLGLRVALSIARLEAAAGNVNAAGSILREAIGAIHGGDATRDFVEAKRHLAEWGR